MVEEKSNAHDYGDSRPLRNQTSEVFSFPIALDVGTVRVGVARSILGIVYPLMVLDRAQSRAEKEILALICREKIDGIVVGLPLSDDGRENKQCLDIHTFTKRLRRRTPVPIVFQDEYLSSLESDGHDGKAAALILQRFITKQW
jgi:putative Holliday junction resolvase